MRVNAIGDGIPYIRETFASASARIGFPSLVPPPISPNDLADIAQQVSSDEAV